MTKIEQSNRIELEKLLTSKLSQETGAKVMGSWAHHLEQIGEARGMQISRKEEKYEVVTICSLIITLSLQFLILPVYLFRG